MTEAKNAHVWAKFFNQFAPKNVTQPPAIDALVSHVIVEGRSLLRHLVDCTTTPIEFSTAYLTHVTHYANTWHPRNISLTLDAPSLLTHPRWPIHPSSLDVIGEFATRENTCSMLIDNAYAQWPVPRTALYDLSPFEWQLRYIITNTIGNACAQRDSSLNQTPIFNLLHGLHVPNVHKFLNVSLVEEIQRIGFDKLTLGSTLALKGHLTYLHMASLYHQRILKQKYPRVDYLDRSNLDALTQALLEIGTIGSLNNIIVDSHDPEALAALLCLIHGMTHSDRKNCKIYLYWFGTYWFNIREMYNFLYHGMKHQCPHVNVPYNSWIGAVLITTSCIVEWPSHESDMSIIIDSLALFTAHAKIGSHRVGIIQSANRIHTCLLSHAIELYHHNEDKEERLASKKFIAYNEVDEMQWLFFLTYITQVHFFKQLGDIHIPWAKTSLGGAYNILYPTTYTHAYFDTYNLQCVRPSSLLSHYVRVRRFRWILDHWSRIYEVKPRAHVVDMEPFNQLRDTENIIGVDMEDIRLTWLTSTLFHWASMDGHPGMLSKNNASQKVTFDRMVRIISVVDVKTMHLNQRFADTLFSI